MDLSERLASTLGMSPETQLKLLFSLAIIVLLWVLRALILWVVRRRTDEVRTQYQWKKVSAYILVPLGALAIYRIWFGGLASVATYFGLLSAGLAIALKDPLVNLAGWVFILWRRPFGVGDRVQLGDVAGDVIDLRIFQFTLMEIGNWVDADQSTGRVVHIPNGAVFTQPLANYTKGFQFIWNELPVLITFESNWEKAKRILQDVVDKHSLELTSAASERVREAAQRFMIKYTKLTPKVYTSVADSGVLLTMRYLCDPRRRRGSAEEIWEFVLREFAACDDIDFAYPTQRFFDNRREGKPGSMAGDSDRAIGADGLPEKAGIAPGSNE